MSARFCLVDLQPFLECFFSCRFLISLMLLDMIRRFSHDKFGVVVGSSNRHVDGVKELLSSSGADEVEVRDGL